MSKKKTTSTAKPGPSYKYDGPTVTLPIGGEEVTLVAGREYRLPAANPKVKRLVSRGHLTEIKEKENA